MTHTRPLNFGRSAIGVFERLWVVSITDRSGMQKNAPRRKVARALAAIALTGN